MPLIGVPLKPGDTGDNVRALQNKLTVLGLSIAANERDPNAPRRFGDTTLAAVLGFRKRHGLPQVANNAAPFDASVDRLLNIARGAVLGNNRVLRDAVRESFAAAQSPPEAEIAALATYATIGLDFTTARKAVALAPGNAEISGKVAPVVSASTFQPAQPEIQNPENYYTCRYDYVPQEVLDELLGRTAGSFGPRARLRLARRRPIPRDDDGDWPEVSDSVPDPEPPPPQPQPGADARKVEIGDAAIRWVSAVDLWQRGNREFKRQRYANAVTAYESCHDSVIRYFEKFYKIDRIEAPISDHARNHRIILRFVQDQNIFPKLWDLINRRRVSLSLRELQNLDWGGFSSEAENLIRKNLDTTSTNPEDNAPETVTRQQSLDYFALLLATIFVPLARAEANRLRRFSASVVEDLRRVLAPVRVIWSSGFIGNSQLFQQADIRLTCDFIERPFALLALGETRMEEAEVQFKTASQGKADEARATYQSIPELFKDHGAYVTRVTEAQKKLTDEADQLPQLTLDRKDIALQVFGKDVTVKGIESKTRELPGLSQTKAPAESWLVLKDTVDDEVNAETNPRIYTLLLNAQARLLQIEHGFNYLGYKDDYIPPWRFQFLLDRARYFSEHAKNAQRDYLNFLNNAENEEFQEQSAAQAVEMEKANVSIETKRNEQAGAEYHAALESESLANLTAFNARTRLAEYEACIRR